MTFPDIPIGADMTSVYMAGYLRTQVERSLDTAMLERSTDITPFIRAVDSRLPQFADLLLKEKNLPRYLFEKFPANAYNAYNFVKLKHGLYNELPYINGGATPEDFAQGIDHLFTNEQFQQDMLWCFRQFPRTIRPKRYELIRHLNLLQGRPINWLDIGSADLEGVAYGDSDIGKAESAAFLGTLGYISRGEAQIAKRVGLELRRIEPKSMRRMWAYACSTDVGKENDFHHDRLDTAYTELDAHKKKYPIIYGDIFEIIRGQRQSDIDKKAHLAEQYDLVTTMWVLQNRLSEHPMEQWQNFVIPYTLKDRGIWVRMDPTLYDQSKQVFYMEIQQKLGTEMRTIGYAAEMGVSQETFDAVNAPFFR